MKAMVAHDYGPPEVLKLEDVPRPAPKENEILVRVIASGVNPVDTLIVSGKYAKEFGTHLPLTPGYVPWVNPVRSPRDFFAFPPFTQ